VWIDKLNKCAGNLGISSCVLFGADKRKEQTLFAPLENWA
jgi:hypothetical protein